VWLARTDAAGTPEKANESALVNGLASRQPVHEKDCPMAIPAELRGVRKWMALAALIVFFAADAVGERHPLVFDVSIVILSAVVLALVVEIIQQRQLAVSSWRDTANRDVRRAALSVALIFIAAAMFGLASFVLTALQWASFKPDGSHDLGIFVGYYVWLALDTLPGLHIPEALNWQTPLAPHDIPSGLFVIAFRAYLLLVLLSALRSMWHRVETSTQIAPKVDA